MNQQEFYEKIPDWISKDKDSWNHITLIEKSMALTLG